MSKAKELLYVDEVYEDILEDIWQKEVHNEEYTKSDLRKYLEECDLSGWFEYFVRELKIGVSE